MELQQQRVKGEGDPTRQDVSTPLAEDPSLDPELSTGTLPITLEAVFS